MIHYTGFIPLVALALLLASMVGLLIKKGRPMLLFKLASLLLIVGWLIYAYAFVALDYTLYEVFWNTSPGLPLWLRFASSWAGGGSSLFLFSFIVALASLFVLRGQEEKRWLALGLAIMIAVSLVAAFLSDAFRQIEETVGGAGLNPLLKSIWIFPHPLTTFGGYALLAVASLSMLAGLKKRGYIVFELGWAFLTLGIAIGGYWSYETFGWGGYWAWDPVETAELMVWLAATLYPHLNVVSHSLKRLVLFFIPSTVFLAMYVTRTGLSPLHSFSSPNIGMMFLLATSIGFLALAFYSISKVEVSKQAVLSPIRDGSPYRLGMYLTTIAFILSFFFVFGSLLVPSIMTAIGMDVSVPQMASGIQFYHPVLYPIMVLLLAGMPMVFLGNRLGWRGYCALMVTTFLVSGVFALAVYQGIIVLAPLSPIETNMMMAFGLPLTSVALFSALVDFVLRARRGIKGLSERMAGINLLHVGMALTIIGILLSGTYSFNEAYFWDATLKTGEPVTMPDGTVILLKDYRYEISDHPVDIYTNYVKRLTSYFLGWEGIHAISRDLSPAVAGVEEGRALIAKDEILRRMIRLPSEGFELEGPLMIEPEAGGLVEVDVARNTEAPLPVLPNRTAVMIVEDPRLAPSVSSIPGEDGKIKGTEVSLMLRGSNVTVYNVAIGEMAEGFHKYYRYVIERGSIEISVGNITVYPTEFEIYSRRMMRGENGVVANGTSLTIMEPLLYITGYAVIDGENVTLPYVTGSGVYTYMMVSGNPYFIQLNRSSLYPLLLNGVESITDCGQPDPAACAGYVAVPKTVPENARMVLLLEVTDPSGRTTEHEVEIRFEVNGEVQGIHGLVPKVVHTPLTLTDMYLVVYPPMAKSLEGLDMMTYHELLVYYLSAVFKQLQPSERLALTAVLVGGYYQDSVMPLSPAERSFRMEKAIVDLYLLAENFDPANSAVNTDGLAIRMKPVPGVIFVWLGSLIMAASAIYTMALTGRPKGKKR